MRRKEKSCEKAAGCRTCKRGLVADSALERGGFELSQPFRVQRTLEEGTF